MYFLEQKLTQNKTASAFLKKAFQRYFIDAMGAMALGLFSSLIIGLILSQLSKFSFLGFLEPYAAMVSASSPVVGAAIGVAIAQGLKSKPLVLFSCAVSGAYGYAVGGPVGAYIGAVFGAEIGGLVAGKTKVDIIVSPITTIVSGCAVAQLVGPGIQAMMNGLGAVINSATQLTPFPMGILVSVIVGMVLTAPISSAALCIMLDLNGLAAGAAVVGCCCQMVGFAVASFRENGWGGSDQPGHRYFYAAVFQYYAPSADLDCAHIGLGSAGSRFHLPVSNDQYRLRCRYGHQRIGWPVRRVCCDGRRSRSLVPGDFDALCPARRSEFFVRLVFAQNRLGQRRLYENQLIFLSAQ